MADATVVSIVEPSADAQMIDLYNRKMRRGNQQTIATGQKYAVCLLELNAAVTQPGDYATLKAAVEGITGITKIRLFVDGQAPSSIPVGKEVRLCVDVHERIDDDPDYVPE